MERLAILREPERKRLTGLSRVQWWRLEKRDESPGGFSWETTRSDG